MRKNNTKNFKRENIMKHLFITAALLITTSAYAEDTVKTMVPGDTIMGVCTAGTICPTPDEPSQFSKKHGYQHPHRAEDLKEDCTTCHNLYGNDGIVASRNISCASVDEFVPPMGVGDIFDTSDAGVEFSTTGTKVGYLPKGTPIKCYSCHEEVDVYINGREREFEFEDIREQILDAGNGDNPPVEPPVEPPTGPVYSCTSKEMQEKHDFTPTPNTNCSSCHNDNRTCE